MAIISVDTFKSMSLFANPQFEALQAAICGLFLIDVWVDFYFGKRNLRAIVGAVVFSLLCIPWFAVIQWLGISASGQLLFVLKIVPILRSVTVFTTVAARLNRNFADSLIISYLLLMVVMVYFASMLFFIEEHPVNPHVTDYWTALWWAAMTLTTAGCNIPELTPAGKVLAVAISAGGIMMFPVFTVYISSSLKRLRNQ